MKPRVRDLAAERQQEMQEWYHGLRRYIEAPTPQVSNREFLRRQRLGQELVWRSADLSPHVVDLFFGCALRYAFGEMVSRIQWDQARRGYWFWGDAAARCPRAGSPRGVAGPGKQIMGIEEYAVLWRFSKDVLGVTLDINTKTLLRTTLDRSCSIPHALHASSKSGAYVEVGYDEIVREGDPLEGIRLVERLAA